MQTELDRSFKTLGSQDIPAYFIGYTLTDTQRAEVSGSNGALLSSSEVRNRWLQVAVRTGDYNKDNTHKVGERQLPSGGPGTVAPIDDDAEVLRRAIWLEKGRLAADGPAAETVALYRERVAEEEGSRRGAARAQQFGEGTALTPPLSRGEREKRIGSGAVVVEEVRLLDGQGRPAGRIVSGEPAVLEMRVRAAASLSDFVFGFGIATVSGASVFGTNTDIDGFLPKDFSGEGRVALEIPAAALAPGVYSVDAAVHARDGAPFDYRRDALRFEVTADRGAAGVWNPPRRWRFDGTIRWRS